MHNINLKNNVTEIINNQLFEHCGYLPYYHLYQNIDLQFVLGKGPANTEVLFFVRLTCMTFGKKQILATAIRIQKNGSNTYYSEIQEIEKQ